MFNATTSGLGPAAAPTDAHLAQQASARMSAASMAPLAPAPDNAAAMERHTRYSVDPAGRRTATTVLRVSGITCAACALPIEEALRSVDGVIRASVNTVAERATLVWDAQRIEVPAFLQSVSAAVSAAGYGAAPDHAATDRELRRRESRLALWRAFVAAFCAMQIMMLATPAYVSRPGELAPDLLRLLNWGSWVLMLPVLLFSATPFFQGAWRALRTRYIGMDVPVALGIAVAFIASSGAAADPGGAFGSEVYFDSIAMFVAFLLTGRAFELRARHRAAESLEGAAGVLPEQATRLRADGQTERVDRDRLQVGDLLLVAAGEAFAADGVVTEGCTAADESLLSGESVPQRKAVGAEVVAGSINLDAPVRMRVLRIGGDTRHDAIVSLVREAQSQRPASARWADRWAGPFLWVVLVLAAGAAAVWSVIDPSRAVWVAVSVLIVTCPCALSLATPSALLAAAGGLARRGVLLRRLEALETMARCDHLVIDKTGTLTEDRPRYVGCERLESAAGIDEKSLVDLAASLAAWSRHPLAQALAHAQAHAGRPTATDALGEPVTALSGAPAGFVSASAGSWQDLREEPGAGIEGRDKQGRAWRLGRREWVGGNALIESAPDEDRADSSGLHADPAEPDAGLEAWFGPVGEPMARLRFDETLRPGVFDAVAALRADGLRVTLLSGDVPARVARMGALLGIDQATGGASPADKLAVVRAAQARGERVVMIGDGINDAPVLAQAEVSIAMGTGALLARSQADAVLLADRLSDVLDLRLTSRRCLRVIRQNIGWAAAYNAICIPVALAGWLPPWAAGLGMASSSLLVVANAMRLRR